MSVPEQLANQLPGGRSDMFGKELPHSIELFLKLYATWLILKIGLITWGLGLWQGVTETLLSTFYFAFVAFFTLKQKWWIRALYLISTIIVGFRFLSILEFGDVLDQILTVTLLGFDAASIFFLYHRQSDQWFKGQYRSSGTLYGSTQQFAQAQPTARPARTGDRVEPTFKGNL